MVVLKKEQSDHRFIAAIDPDVSASGFALLDTAGDGRMTVVRKSFPDMVETFRNFAAYERELKPHSHVVVVEASWLLHSNWHLNRLDTRQRSAAKGYAVGRNHEVGRKICEMAKSLRLDVVEHLPLRKCWHGADGKITQKEIERLIPNFPKRTNQDERDAALLAWLFANKPVRMPPRCLTRP